MSESEAGLVALPHVGSEGVQEAARRVVKGDISPSTTTSSARIELDYDGHDLDGARGDRWSSDGCCGGSSCDASSQRPHSSGGSQRSLTGRHRRSAVLCWRRPKAQPGRSRCHAALEPRGVRVWARAIARTGRVLCVASGKKLATKPDP